MNILNKILDFFTNLIEEYGAKKVIIGSLISIVVFFFVIPRLLIWENKESIKVTPLIDSMDLVKQDLSFDAVRTAEFSEGLSLIGMVGDGLLSVHKYGDYASMANDLKDKCEKISKKQEKINIPKDAGYIEGGDIKIYSWNKTGERKLTEQEFFEKKLLFIIGNEYIVASMENESEIIGINGSIQVGNIN